MSINDVTNPQLGELTVRVSNGSSAVEFTRMLSYSLVENWLGTSDTFACSFDQRELSKDDLAVLVPGSIVQPCIDGHVQSYQILDEVTSTAATGQGSVLSIECRDWMSLAIDSQVDPQQRFVPSMTLLQLVSQAYAQIGVDLVVGDSISNRNVITGRIYGTHTTSKGKVPKHILLGENKPYPNEGLFQFTSRISQRFGLWIRPFVDGTTIVLAGPDFDQSPRYGLVHAYDSRGTQNNVVHAHFQKSRKEQPSIIYAYAPNGGGGDFPKSRLHAGIVNPVIDADNSAVISKYVNVPMVAVDPVTAAFPPFAHEKARPAFLVDRESHTQDQLEAFLKRELSLRMRKALCARYEIMGHKLNGQPIAVDTIVSVLDQQPGADWDGPLWVLGRQFHKTPSTGARTTLELILPGSIQL